MLDTILSGQQEVLLAEERALLRGLQAGLARWQAGEEDQATLERSIASLDELFLLVVVGEFNSGKSTFINALLGERLLEEGVTPTTRRIHRLRHGETRQRQLGDDGIEEIAAPIDLLRQVRMVDTPGTNALDREHEAITRRFVPRSDLVLFVTSADRPLTESERAFIESIREWGKKLVLVINKVDFLANSKGALDEVRVFVEENAKKILGAVPPLFAVSARDALSAKTGAADPTLVARSGFEELEIYLRDTLDEKERVRLKLLSPLGVARRLASDYLASAEESAELLRDDFATLEEIEGQLAVYQEDMAAAFRYRLSDVDNELHEFERRGDEFFEETLRLSRAIDLMNRSKIQADFERKVVADAPKRLEEKVESVIDWMVEAELKQWQATHEQIAKRRTEASAGANLLPSLDYNRGRLLETVGRTAQRTIRSYDQQAEAGRMAESVRTAVAGTALIEAGAVGLGTVFTLLATSTAADVTGLVAAGTLAVLGLFVLPARRRKAKQELSKKIATLRDSLMTSLTAQFDREVEGSAHRIREAIAPYTRFVRAERERLEEMRRGLGEISANLERLQDVIEGA
ncbi:MAG: dynamin family protein [Thermoanaerobaculia bacterium]|nr:dynamin family protein [Thermoanaerobaculia bacterium]